MDRTNLSAANIAGMAVELELIGFRYSIITLVFFITYVIFQFPATIIIKKLGPRFFLTLVTLLWGSVMIGMGFVHNWRTLAGLRVILGIFEAGFFPGSVYLLSTWYIRYEVQKTIFCFLYDWVSCFCLCWHTSIWRHANGWHQGIPWLEMDLHH